MSRVRLSSIATPATPPSGRAELFYDAADKHLKVLTEDGIVYDLGELTRGADYFRHVGTSPVERWYPAGLLTAQAFGSSPLTYGNLYAFPFLTGRGGTIDKLSINVTTAGTVLTGTGKARVTICDATSLTNMYPGAKLYDLGEQVVTATGVLSYAGLSIQPPKDWLWWIAIEHDCDAGNVTLRANALAQTECVLGTDTAMGANAATGWIVAHTYGALGASFPASANPTSALEPQFAMRYSA